MEWLCGRFRLDLTTPKIMGIVNITPDSFSAVKNSLQSSAAIQIAEAQLKDGAHILDLGAESTRPGAVPLSHEAEWQRLEPVLKEVVQWNIPVSVDSYHAQTMDKALAMGADIINDVWALRQAGAVDAVAANPACGVCLMHMHLDPSSMQMTPMQGDVLAQVKAFLQQRVTVLRDVGVAKERICLDPGIGFGKTVEQNFTLLRYQAQLLDLGLPLLVGWSRKSSLGAVTGLDAAERLLPSVVSAVLAAQNGAKILRVHDVKETLTGLQVWQAMENAHTDNNESSRR